MKIKPMGSAVRRKLLSEATEDIIRNEMKLNSLFGFDVVNKKKNPAYCDVKILGIDATSDNVFCSLPIDVETNKEFVVNPNYSISDIERDENGQSIMPDFAAMDKMVDVRFNLEESETNETYIKFNMSAAVSTVNQVDNAPKKIEINSTADNTFELFSTDYYLIINLVPSNMNPPMIKIIDITEPIIGLYSDNLGEIAEEQNFYDDEDEEYDVLDDATTLDPDGSVFKSVLDIIVKDIWETGWIFTEIANYDRPCDSFECSFADFYSTYEIVYNSFYSKFTSKIIDTSTEEVLEEYKDMPMTSYLYDFNNYMKYAAHEDLSRVVAPMYYYSNESGVTVEVSPTVSNKLSTYKMFYNGIEYYSIQYRPSGIPFGFSPFDKKYETMAKPLDKSSKDYGNCQHVCALLPEIGTQIEVYKLKEFYYVKSRTGSVKIALDLSSLFFMTYCADSVNFQTKILIGLHDLKKNKRIFVTTIGMNSSIVGKDDEDVANNLAGMSSIYDYHIFTYTKLDDTVELLVENIISVAIGNNTGFLLRTTNNPAEGRITLELKDKAAKAKIANMDSVYYNDNADIIFVRDMFGVPTPVQIEH